MFVCGPMDGGGSYNELNTALSAFLGRCARSLRYCIHVHTKSTGIWQLEVHVRLARSPAKGTVVLFIYAWALGQPSVCPLVARDGAAGRGRAVLRSFVRTPRRSRNGGGREAANNESEYENTDFVVKRVWCLRVEDR